MIPRWFIYERFSHLPDTIAIYLYYFLSIFLLHRKNVSEITDIKFAEFIYLLLRYKIIFHTIFLLRERKYFRVYCREFFDKSQYCYVWIELRPPSWTKEFPD